jgi:hypothetical protein
MSTPADIERAVNGEENAAESGSRKRAARAGLPGLRPSEITHNGSPSRPRAGSSLNTRDEASHAIWLVGVRALLRVEARLDLEWLLGGLGARQRGLVTRSSYRPPTWAQLPAADVGAATGRRRGRSDLRPWDQPLRSRLSRSQGDEHSR